MHALGERRLKDIDEPERIYELEIEGVEQAAGPPPATSAQDVEEEEWENRYSELGARLSKRINEGVYGALERSFGLDKRG